MKNNKNKFCKNSNLNLKKLMENQKFIDEILKIDDGKEIIKKFNLYGVDLASVEFRDLCDILLQRLQIRKNDFEVSSINEPISVDYTHKPNRTLAHFRD